MEEVDGKRKKRTRQRIKAGAPGSEAAVAGADEDEDSEEDRDDGDEDLDSVPLSFQLKRTKRSATAIKVTLATKGRRDTTTKPATKAQLSESDRASVQLGETFDFSSDLGHEDVSASDGFSVRTRARGDPLDLDILAEDEDTDDEPDDVERSFARLDAAQDALDLAAAEPISDSGSEAEDVIGADSADSDDLDDDSFAIVGDEAALLTKGVVKTSSNKETTTSRRRRSPDSVRAAAITSSFGATKPVRHRVPIAVKGSSTAADTTADDSDGLSPLARPVTRAGAPVQATARSKPKSKKVVPAYIEISD